MASNAPRKSSSFNRKNMNSPQLRDALTQQIKSTAQRPSKLLEKRRRLRDSTQSQAHQNSVNPNLLKTAQMLPPIKTCIKLG